MRFGAMLVLLGLLATVSQAWSAPLPHSGKPSAVALLHVPPPAAPFYPEFPSSGFRLDESLFRSVHRCLKNEYVTPLSDRALYRASAREVEALLRSLGIAPGAMVARDASLPHGVVTRYGRRVGADLLCYSMVRGLLAATNDPGNALLTPDGYRRLARWMQSPDFGGLMSVRFPVPQEPIAAPTRRMLPGRMGLIELRWFGTRTGRDVSEALLALRARGARGLIVDVRNNSGGSLSGMLDVCGSFVSSILHASGRGGAHSYAAPTPRERCSLPVVLLVNEYSSGAAEVLAACLKDSRRAMVFGAPTSGGASLQRLVPLLGGGALSMTVARICTAGGLALDAPVSPDTGVAMDPSLVGSGGDVQLARALEYLRHKDLASAYSRGTARFTIPRRS